jgi:hypothetical protein
VLGVSLVGLFGVRAPRPSAACVSMGLVGGGEPVTLDALIPWHQRSWFQAVRPWLAMRRGLRARRTVEV